MTKALKTTEICHISGREKMKAYQEIYNANKEADRLKHFKIAHAKKFSATIETNTFWQTRNGHITIIDRIDKSGPVPTVIGHIIDTSNDVTPFLPCRWATHGPLWSSRIGEHHGLDLVVLIRSVPPEIISSVFNAKRALKTEQDQIDLSETKSLISYHTNTPRYHNHLPKTMHCNESPKGVHCTNGIYTYN